MEKMNKAGRRPQNMAKTLKRLMTYLWRNKFQLGIVVVALIISTVASVAGTYFIRPLINDFVASKDVNGLLRMIGLIVLIYMCGVCASYFSVRLMVVIGQKTIKTIRMELFDHIQKLPIRFFDTHKHGDLMSRFTNDFDNIQNAFNNSLLMLLTSALQLVLTFIMMLILSPLLTIMIVIMLAIMMYIVKFVGSRSAKYFGMQQKTLGKVNGYIEEHIEGQKVIKVFNHEQKVLEEFEELNQELNRSAQKAQFYANTMFPILGNISYVNYALTATVGGYLVISGMMDVGALASFLQFSRTFAQPLAQISQQSNVLLAALAGAERIFSILDEHPEVDEGKVSLDQSDEDQWYWLKDDNRIPVVGKIILEHVDFGYTKDVNILKDINVWAEPGLKIAFVGATGAGKTTITNLINRFYEIDAGTITFDGIPITQIKKEDLRRTISIVLQDTHLFTGTIADNIRYGRLNASDDEVVQAAKLANAHSFIKRLPEGYRTVITGDGEGLSQGQRQLLAIARAAVANPKVLILDEATSSIDSHTEGLISQGMDQLMYGRTSFVIAHRLSTIRNADVIMVMDHGEIIERGNHEDLMANQGMYYKLYTGQIELD
ncbi:MULTISPECIES: ABC transporter ATP-binding protein [unclassified Granulicatella]|uniref:ABC transporter ATP-binding protein n=1 Tax=unclassified Granulicatella TaxID=2630493 RepID=UPI0010735F9D|nr:MULTISPECIES: ABC transporter ATP-binding protein [unclassified Granulicatella]MBF0779676.1 ABC transporter ATP-binding protein [Granulicatella sp. 19428wC4_WM01]TFU96330.1 ABC transporter ATP-binding protein [Granulicatella sp. WM01]